MKTKSIIAGLTAMSTVLSAQIFNTNVGVYNTSPTFNLDINASSPSNGIRVKRGTYGAAGITLENTTTGGKNFSLFSLGYLDAAGAGNFSIFQNFSPTTGAHRLFIDGTEGTVGINTTALPMNARLHVEENVANRWAAGYFNMNVPGGATNRGISAEAQNGSQNIASQFVASGTGVQNIGVWAVTSGNWALRPNDWAGYFGGNVYVGNNLDIDGTAYFSASIVAGSSQISDRKLKKDIIGMESSIDLLMQLKPKSYFFDGEKYSSYNLPKVKQYGLIAQELQEVLPDLVKESHLKRITDPKTNEEIRPELDLLTVDYVSLIPFLIRGIQEQQEHIVQLNYKIDAQNATISGMKEKTSSSTGISVNSAQLNASLSQNEPNPFAHETVIKYSVNTDAKDASIVVYDLTGKQINKFPLTEKGNSSLTISAESLHPGIYIYSIVVDGSIIDTKQMVVSDKK